MQERVRAAGNKGPVSHVPPGNLAPLHPAMQKTATSFTVLSPTLIQTTVPAGTKAGKVSVTTPNGAATSKQTFTIN